MTTTANPLWRAAFAERLCAAQTEPGQPGNGLWQIYSGGILPNVVRDNPRPADYVIDLDSLTMPERCVALHQHREWSVVGAWSELAKDRTIRGRLHLLTGDAAAVPALASATELRTYLDQGVPLEASVSAEPGPAGSWESVSPGQVIAVNGREISARTGRELYVLRGGLLREVSIVTLGADLDRAHQIAAAIAPITNQAAAPETTMPTLPERRAALLAKHGDAHAALISDRLIAGDSDDAISAAATAAAHSAELSAAQAQASAARAEADELKAERDTLKAERDALAADKQTLTGQLTAARGGRPLPASPAQPTAPLTMRRADAGHMSREQFAAFQRGELTFTE